MWLAVGLIGVNHLCSLHLKPGLLIKMTSVSTVRIRIAALCTFRQTAKWNYFFIFIFCWGKFQEKIPKVKISTLGSSRLLSSSNQEDANKCLGALKIPQLTSLLNPVCLLRCAPESQSPCDANNHQRCPPLYRSIT